jgi:hypothetical protein
MDTKELFEVTSVLEDLAVKSFDMNEIDDMIDKNWLGSVTSTYFPDSDMEEWMNKQLEATKAEDRAIFDAKNDERKKYYKTRRNEIFNCKTHLQLEQFMDRTDNFILEPDLDWNYNGLLWAIEKRSGQIDEEAAYKRRERERMAFAKKMAAALQTKEAVPVTEPFVPVIMKLRGTSTLKRVEERYVMNALIKQGYEVIS